VQAALSNVSSHPVKWSVHVQTIGSPLCQIDRPLHRKTGFDTVAFRANNRLMTVAAHESLPK
jgi:hypothetical protein